MGILLKVVKKTLKVLRKKIVMYKSKNSQASERSNAENSEVEHMDDARPHEATPEASTSADSGIATPGPSPVCKGPRKKLQFVVQPEVHEIENNPYERRSSGKMGPKDVLLRVKFSELPTPQKPLIIDRVGSEDSVLYYKPCDQEFAADYSPPISTNAPPSMQTATDSLQTPSHSSLSSDEVHMMLTLSRPVPVYTQVTPKSLRTAKLSTESNNCPSSKESTIDTLNTANFQPPVTSSADDILSDESQAELSSGPRDHKGHKQDYVESRFVVNVYESRHSKKHLEQKKQLIRRKKNDKQVAKDITLVSGSLKRLQPRMDKFLDREREELERERQGPELGPIQEGITQLPCQVNLETVAKFRWLRKARDIECLKQSQGSKVLYEIKTKGSKDWLERLVAEKVLLESGERKKLLEQLIREALYISIQEPLLKGTLSISEIEFPFVRTGVKQVVDSHHTLFFLMTISNGSTLMVSEFTTSELNVLKFKRRYTFEDTPDFEIKIKLFCLKLRTSKEYFWEKFLSCSCPPTTRIIYQNYQTQQFQDETVFRTSFKLCAETTLTRHNINDPSTRLQLYPEVFDRLHNEVLHKFTCDSVNVDVAKSGFLDMGKVTGNTFYWESKWCVLKETELAVYNYPGDEDMARPVEQINLQYCFGPILKVKNCPKARSFQLHTGRPVNDPKGENYRPSQCLESKPNFLMRKFYFSARSAEEYKEWTFEVSKSLESLKYFKKLFFHYDETRSD